MNNMEDDTVLSLNGSARGNFYLISHCISKTRNGTEVGQPRKKITIHF